MSFLLALNKFHPLLWCTNYWIWTSKYRLSMHYKIRESLSNFIHTNKACFTSKTPLTVAISANDQSSNFFFSQIYEKNMGDMGVLVCVFVHVCVCVCAFSFNRFRYADVFFFFFFENWSSCIINFSLFLFLEHWSLRVGSRWNIFTDK